MIKSALFILIILLTVLRLCHAKVDVYDELKLIPQQQISPISVFLTEDDQRWLKGQKTLRIGIYPQEHSPVVQSMFAGQYRGINADYLEIIKHSLNIDIKVINLGDNQKAIQALSNGELDAILTGLEYAPNINDSLISSIAVAHSSPALVARVSNILSPLSSQEDVRVSAVSNYPDDQFIYESFPNAKIIRYDTDEDALNALSEGKDDYFIGDSLTTSIWLSQEFRNTIVTLKYWGKPQKKSNLLFPASETRLQNIINNVLKGIDDNIHSQIAFSAIDKGNLSFLIDPISFTPQEKKWLAQNNKVRVIVNPWYIPFTLVDKNTEVRGITGDLLNLISLQAGISFESVVVNSYDEMLAEAKKGGNYIMAPIIYEKKNANTFSYTQPFLNTQFVSVVSKEHHNEATLQPEMRVAISDNHPLLSELKIKYPNIKWMVVKNVSVALNLVASKKVDAAIANRLAARYFSEHYYPDQLVWQTIPDVMPAGLTFAVPKNEPELKSILDKARNNIPQREILQIVSKWLRLPNVKISTWELYNKPFYLVALLASLLVISSTLWVIYLAIEVRKRKRSQRLLIEEKNKAQQANKKNREFLSRMSHEIRTPVSAIIGYLELLQQSSAKFNSEDRVSISQAAQASHSLLKLIGEILDLEKAESGIIDVIPKWGKVDSLIEDKITLFHAIASKKEITISYTSTLVANQAMLLDFQLLGQVLNNVLGNAVKFTQKGSIDIQASLHNESLIIRITDTGPGIAKNVQSRLFDAFIQAGHHSAEQGSGLGLTICKALMTRMNGTISIDSKVNKGTTLTITLPAEVDTDTHIESSQTTDLSISIDSNLRVLIADDQPASRLLLKRQLATLGIQPDEAADGQAALTQLQQAPYDILITDVNMPIMDGITLATTLRKYDTHLFICGLTATAQTHERERCLAAGMNTCLFKPVNISQIALLLSEIKPETNSVFDIKRLTLLAQGNRLLMLNALQDAQKENYNDLSKANQAFSQADYQSMKYHIHRISGTALLLGANALAEQAQQLEETLLTPESKDELSTMLECIRTLLAEFDIAVQNFKP